MKYQKNTDLLTDGVGVFTKPTECVRDIVEAYTAYMQIAEEERTKRSEIRVREKTTIARINAQREFLIGYLERSFDERAENFRNLFSVVDRALVSGNNDQLALALHSITEIAKSSPFKELVNLADVQAALANYDHEWTF